jgi:guanine nucleotide-binding protein subunit alpha
VRSFHLILDAITRAQKALQSSSSASIDDIPQIPPELLKRKLKLAALLNVEGTLIRRLTHDGSGETEATQLARSNGGASGQNGGAGGPSGGGVGGKSPVVKELAVNSTNPWKDTFNRLVHGEGRDSFDSGDAIDWDDPEDPGRILHDLSDDMNKLWNDPITQILLEKQNLRMQELAGLYVSLLPPFSFLSSSSLITLLPTVFVSS